MHYTHTYVLLQTTVVDFEKRGEDYNWPCYIHYELKMTKYIYTTFKTIWSQFTLISLYHKYSYQCQDHTYTYISSHCLHSISMCINMLNTPISFHYIYIISSIHPCISDLWSHFV